MDISISQLWNSLCTCIDMLVNKTKFKHPLILEIMKFKAVENGKKVMVTGYFDFSPEDKVDISISILTL